jgi:hypothetical protein
MLLATLAALGGCASAVDGFKQTVMVRAATLDGRDVADAECEVANDKGTWHVRTPGAVTVHRSANAITVACVRPGYVAAGGAATSVFRSLAMGNLLVGGLPVVLDIANGSAYDYPETLVLNMQPAETAAVPAIPKQR